LDGRSPFGSDYCRLDRKEGLFWGWGGYVGEGGFHVGGDGGGWAPPAPVRATWAGLRDFLIKVRLKNFNHGSIDPDHNFSRDRDRGKNFSIRVWLKIKNQSLLKKFQSGFDDQKLNTCALLHKSA
jgi:hypothetical protein